MTQIEAMDSLFAYKIGDRLQHKATQKQLSVNSQSIGVYDKTCYTVIERLAQQCHGGIQLQYRCHLTNIAGTVGTTNGAALLDLMEMEVEPFMELFTEELIEKVMEAEKTRKLLQQKIQEELWKESEKAHLEEKP